MRVIPHEMAHNLKTVMGKHIAKWHVGDRGKSSHIHLAAPPEYLIRVGQKTLHSEGNIMILITRLVGLREDVFQELVR